MALQRVALRIAYAGADFPHGSARQPGAHSVSGELLAGMAACGAVPAGRERLGLASRTDGGVGALANVAAVDSQLAPQSLAAALQQHCRRLYVTGAAGVPEQFEPRHAAIARSYRYLLPRKGLSFETVAQAGALFVGTHDIGAFCRRDGRSTVRQIDSVAVRRKGACLTIDVVAPSFLWNQVRRMVGAMVAVGRGDVEVAQVRAVLRAGRPLRGTYLPVAPAEGLVLRSVTIPGVRFSSSEALRRQLGRRLQVEQLEGALQRQRLELLGRICTPTKQQRTADANL